jgi:pimeloyl-ACP methyl ester carboxylesterase
MQCRSFLLFIAAMTSLASGCQNLPKGGSDMNLNASSRPTQYVDVPGGRLAYDDTGGSGPLVVAIPGMGDLRGEYRYLVPYLSSAGYRVVTMDIRGHGESSVNWDDYSARAVGNDAIALIDHLHAGPAIVMGTSFAAGSAAWAAYDHPDKVSALVYFGPVVRDLPTPFYKKAMINVGFAGPWRVTFWMTFWDSLFPTSKPSDQAGYRSALKSNLSERGRMDALRAMIRLSKRDTEAILGMTAKPTLVVMGTKDPDFPNPATEAKLVADRAEKMSRILLVEGSGHYPHADMPDVVAPKLLEFLKGVR